MSRILYLKNIFKPLFNCFNYSLENRRAKMTSILENKVIPFNLYKFAI